MASPLPPTRPARTPGTTAFRLRLLLWRGRVLLLALLLGTAAAATITAISPAPAPTTPTLVAAGDLDAGTVLTADDVRTAAWPDTLTRPAVTLTADEATGRRLAVAVPAGLPLVPGVLAVDGFDADVPDGTVVAPVRLADPAVAALLRPGDRVDVLGGDLDDTTGEKPGGDDGAQVLARAALVVSGTASKALSPGALDALRPDTSSAGDLVLLAVTPTESRRLAGAGPAASLSVAIVP